MKRSTYARRTRLNLESLEEREVPSFGLDTGFGVGGVAMNPLGADVKFDSVAKIATLADGKILVAGNLQGPAGDLGDIAVARLTPAGAIDTTFGGGDGLVTLNLPRHAVSALATQPGGKMVLGGSQDDPLGGKDFFVLRLNADGTKDTTFGTAGEARVDFGGTDLLSAIAVQSDGKVVAAGRTADREALNVPPTNSGRLAAVRLTTSGMLDTTFGTGGKLNVAPPSGSWTTAGLAIQPDGKIVIGGHATPLSNVINPNNLTELTVYRFNANGTPDTSFDSDGRAQTSYGTFTFAYASSVVLLSDGRIVVAGGSTTANGLLAWFKPDGSLQDEEQTDGLSKGDMTWVSDAVASPLGGVELLGYTFENASYAVEHHASPGSMTDHKTLTVGNGYTLATGLAAQPDGKIIAVSLSSATQSPFNPFPNQLGLVRLGDPGDANSPATTMEGLMSQGPTGGPITFEARVRPVLGPADVGTVTITFREGDKVLGTAVQDSANLAKWGATFTATLPVGDRVITAAFAGNARWAPSKYEFKVRVEGPATYTVGLSSPTVAPRFGEPIVLEATVQRNSNGTTSAADGTVEFFDGNTPLGPAALVKGKATLPVSYLNTGSHRFRAHYLPIGGGFNEATYELSIAPAPTTIEMAPATTSNGFLLLSAKVRSSVANATPLGIVNYYNGMTLLATVSVDDNGMAGAAVPALRTGIHNLRAEFGGNPNFLSATAEQRVTVGLVQTATTLLAPATATAGQPVVLTAKITALSAGFPIGTVTFMEGSTVIGTARVDGRGDAKLSTTLADGALSIRAVYSGCSTCEGSTSAAVSVAVSGAVNRVATTSILTSTVATPVHGQTQILKVKVAAAAGQPTGSVNFYDGSKLLGSSALDSAGNAQISTIVTLGRHNYQAVYAGNTAFAGSTSAVLAQNAPQAATTVVLTGDTGRTTGGATVWFTAKVVPQFGGSPIGTLIFKNGDEIVRTALVDGNGMAKVEIGSLMPGKTHSVTATYVGCSTFKGSVSVPFTVVAA